MAEEKTKKVTQSLLISEDEISLLKKHFADNDEFLQLVRNLFFGLELSKKEKEIIIESFKDKNLRDLMHRRFLPSLNKNIPVGQYVDLWTGVDIKEKPLNSIRQVVLARQKLIQMTKMSLNLLVNPDGEKVNLEFNPNGFDASIDGDLQIDLFARNTFINHIETQLIMIKVIAGQKTETPESARQRLTDSNK